MRTYSVTRKVAERNLSEWFKRFTQYRRRNLKHPTPGKSKNKKSNDSTPKKSEGVNAGSNHHSEHSHKEYSDSHNDNDDHNDGDGYNVGDNGDGHNDNDGSNDSNVDDSDGSSPSGGSNTTKSSETSNDSNG